MNKVVTSLHEASAVLAHLSQSKIIAFDVETTGLDRQKAEIVGFSLSDGTDSWYFPNTHANYENLEPGIVGLMRDFLLNNPVWCYNANYERHVVTNNWGVTPRIAGDPMLAMILLDREEANLKFAARTILNVKNVVEYLSLFPPDSEDKSARRLNPNNIVYLTYACNDSLWTAQLVFPLTQMLKDRDILSVYEMEVQYQAVLFKMEFEGLNVDLRTLQVQIRQYEASLSKLEEEVWTLIDKALLARGEHTSRFKLNSTKRLAECLYDQLGYACSYHTKTGGRSTSQDALDSLPVDPLINTLIKWKSERSILQSYLMKAGDYVENGKIHPDHAQIGESGRVYTRDPNVQNWPMPVRKAIKPDPGHYFLLADYKAQELRIVAALSRDPFFLDVFTKEEDPHIKTITEVTGVAPENVTDEQREFGKVLNYGLVYGMDARGLARRLQIKQSVAAEVIKRFFEKIPLTVAWRNEIIAELERTTYVTTAYGRKRRLPGIKSGFTGDRESAKRAAVNTKCQGSGADMLKMAEIAIDAHIHEMSGMSIKEQVHDSILFQVPNAITTKEAADFVRLHMEMVLNEVKMKVSFKKGQSWGEMEKIND